MLQAKLSTDSACSSIFPQQINVQAPQPVPMITMPLAVLLQELENIKQGHT